MVQWEEVDTVLLDMDGTLLDLHFDHLLWNIRLPERYALRHALPLAEATEAVQTELRARQGTLEWYCLDHWSREFGLDLGALEHEFADAIQVHPEVEGFLAAVRASGRRLVLATNAHPRSLALKMARTGLEKYFHVLVSAHELGAPKEAALFWERLRGRIGFEPARALFVDDNLVVLRAAARFGIGRVLAVARPNSRAPRIAPAEFAQLERFGQLLPVPASALRPVGPA